MLKWLFKKSEEKVKAFMLYTDLVTQSRSAQFYTHMHVDDTLEGRFDMIALHIFIVLRYLESLGAETQNLRQQVMEAMISDLDRSLRELGVGDMAVGKQMKTLGGGLLGRVKAYADGLDRWQTENNADMLDAAIRRNVYRDAGDIHVTVMRDYIIAASAWLGTQRAETLLKEGIQFPSVPELMKEYDYDFSL